MSHQPACLSFVFGLISAAFILPTSANEGDPAILDGPLPAYDPALGFGIEGGNGVNVSNAEFFLPLLQGEDALFFTNFQFQFYDRGSEAISAGLGYRKLIDDSYILGLNAYFDQHEGILGENFTRVTAGFEFLSEKWDFRVNGYFAGAESTSMGGTGLSFVGNRVFLSGGLAERAYDGIDFEAGYRLATFNEGQTELRIYGGGYNFNNEADGFVQIAGSQVRLEAQIFALPLLGEQSQLIASASLRNDDVFDTHSFVGLQVRIPFGKGSAAAAPAPVRLSSLQHRMIQPVNRERFVTNTAGSADEQALDAEGDDLFVVNAGENINAAVANQSANGTVIVNGTVSTPGNVTLKPGQRLASGNSNLTVVGSDSGRRVTGPLPGSPGRINGTNPANPVIVLANNVTVQDLTITGGLNGMLGNTSLSGFTITNNQISGSTGSGFLVNGDIDGMLTNNQVASAGGNGFEFGANDGTISGNTASDSSGIGFFGVANNGEFSSNTASGSGSDGIQFASNAGTITGNRVTNSGDDGINIVGRINSGTISQNSVTDSADNGFEFEDNTGTFSGNSALRSGDSGFDFDDNSGTFSQNSATDSTDNGFEFDSNTGTFSGNSALRSGDSGFDFQTNIGTFTGNSTTTSRDEGFEFDNNSTGAVMSNNTAIGADNDGFDFGVNNGTFTNNVVTDSGDNGFEFGTNNSIFTGNRSSNNGNNGFSNDGDTNFTNSATGTFSNNESNNNGDQGYRGVNNGTAAGNTGAGNGGGNTFP